MCTGEAACTQRAILGPPREPLVIQHSKEWCIRSKLWNKQCYFCAEDRVLLGNSTHACNLAAACETSAAGGQACVGGTWVKCSLSKDGGRPQSNRPYPFSRISSPSSPMSSCSDSYPLWHTLLNALIKPCYALPQSLLVLSLTLVQLHRMLYRVLKVLYPRTCAIRSDCKRKHGNNASHSCRALLLPMTSNF